MKSHRNRARTAAPLAAGLSAALALSALVAAPASAAPAEESVTIVTDVSAPGPSTGTGTVVEGAQLEWSYSRYAQYGVFGAWSMDASGAAVSTGTVDGQANTGLDADAGKTFTVARFDGGQGSLDPETGAGTISWPDTGSWVLNAYNGQYGAPDETLSDPILTIAEDGTGDLSFEAYLPAGLDMNGEPAPAAGPTRIALATFSSVTVENDVITVQPDFAGRSYTPAVGSPWAECAGAGGSWPAAWIDFLPASVQAHYYSTSCSGLNLMKPPTAFTVALDASDAVIATQPADASVDAGQTASFSVTASGNPLAYQWQRSTDGTEWSDIEGATDSTVSIPTAPADDGLQIRALINGTMASEGATLAVYSEAPTLLYSGEDTVAYEGSFVSLGAYAGGIPEPTKQWEVSSDGGATWENRGDVVAASQTLELVPTIGDDGLLARAVFSNGVGDGVTSAPQTLTVVSYSGPSSMWVQGGPLTADDIANWDVAMRASFAGFVLPGGSTTDIQAALVPESALAETNTPSLDDAVWYDTLYASNLGPSNGHQPNLRVEAWQQLDPAVRYYLVTYSTDLGDRSYDSRLLLPIDGQEPDATPIEHATIEFGFNDVHQGASPAGGCNYFVAGKVQGLGSDYTSIDGNVYIIKKHEDGSSEVVSVGTRCTAADPDSSTINQRYLFTEGTGQTAADGSTTIHWTGAGTTNAYGGLVSWYFENPKLVLDASGDGSITADVGGFGSSMDDPTVKVPLDPREGVEIATVRGATIDDGRLTIDPVWKNVDYFPLANPQDPASARSTTSAIPQAAKDANPNWGSWPESFVDFQYATGLSSYWHTSGLTADPLKPPMPIDVAFEGSAPDYGVLFTTEPTSAVLSEGEDVTFHAAASGQTGTPTLQWQVKRAGGEWTDLEGATTGELTLTDVSVADWNGASVRAVATLGDRTATSVVATLTVTAPAAPVFTVQPTDKEALVDQSAYFQVEVTGYPTPTYQWQRQLPGGEWEDVAGATYAWYNYYPITLADDGAAIRVIATNASGSVSSDVVHLSVSTLPVTIQAQPKGLSVFEGGSGWLAAWIDGAPYPTFQWERSLDGSTWDAVEGGNDSVLDFGVVSADEARYQYRLTATNGLASVVTDVVTVTILPPADPPVWVSPRTDLDPAVDTTLAVSLGQLPALPAGSTGLFHIGLIEKSVWQPGDAAVGFDEFVPFAVGNFAPGDLSFVRTEVWVQAGSLDPSKEYGVAVMFEPSGDTAAQPQFDMYVPVTLAQPTVPTVTVSKTSGLDPNGETITVTGSGFLPHSPDTDGTRPPLAGTFTGAYVVFGKFADVWQPSAGAPSSARTGLDTKWGVLAGDLATIGGADRGAIEITPDGTFETTLTVKSGAFDTEGTYGVYTYAGGGAVYAPFETATPVTLNEAAATVTAQPQSVVVTEGGEPAVFTVGVSGAPAPVVQWERQAADGSWAAVEGATSVTLSLPSTKADDGASVRAVVTNGLGSAVSDAARLTVSAGGTPNPVTPETPAGTAPGADPGTGSDSASDSGSDSSALSNTGFEAAGWLAGALLLLLAGAGALIARRAGRG